MLFLFDTKNYLSTIFLTCTSKYSLIGKMVRISIIIPTYNESKYIGRTLAAIKKQRNRDIEVILADSASTDGTVEVAKAKYKSVRVCITKGRGISKACNRSAMKARGEVIVFVEADTSISSGLLTAYDRAFKDPDVVAATGPIRPLEKTSLLNRIGFAIVSVYLTKLSIMMGRPTAIGSNFAVRKSAFRRVHGFNESMVTYQDWDMVRRLGKTGRVVFVDGAVAHTSIRRVRRWGSLRYFAYHASNVMLYNIKRRSRSDYEAIR